MDRYTILIEIKTVLCPQKYTQVYLQPSVMHLFTKPEARKQNLGRILQKLLKIDRLPFTLSLCALKEAKHTKDDLFLVFFLSSVLTIWSVF